MTSLALLFTRQKSFLSETVINIFLTCCKSPVEIQKIKEIGIEAAVCKQTSEKWFIFVVTDLFLSVY